MYFQERLAAEGGENMFAGADNVLGWKVACLERWVRLVSMKTKKIHYILFRFYVVLVIRGEN